MKEQFVVYLFSKFHKELEFEHIVDINTQFPDCIAIKDGKRVSIEFEPESSSLATHLFTESKTVYGQPDYQIKETETDVVVTDGSGSRKYPKSDYKAEIAPRGYIITRKVLDLNYCVCWKITHQPKEEYIKVKFIELSSHPVITDFMGMRKQVLERLGMSDYEASEKQ